MKKLKNFPVEETYYYGECKKIVDTITDHMKKSSSEISDSDFYVEPNVIYDTENGIIDGYYAFKYSTTDKETYEKAMKGFSEGISEVRDEVAREDLSLVGKSFEGKLTNDHTLYSYAMAVEIQQGAYNRIKKEKAKQDRELEKEFGFSKGKKKR